jgi:DNA-binding transcriptional regulator YiaG
MKAYPWKCATCRELAVSPICLPTYTVEGEHDGRKYRITLSNFDVLQCSRCGAIMLSDEADDRITAALRAEIGLLSPSDIRTKRDALGLTQKELANYLKIAESTLCRWETGAQIQQRCMDGILRCFFDLVEVRSYLGVPVVATEKPVSLQFLQLQEK